MRAYPVLALIALPSMALAAGPLPLRSGTYVQSDNACKDAAFAVMRSYDGIGLGDPHSHACRIRIVSHRGARYVVDNSCINAGVGPAPRSTERLSLTILSRTGFAVGKTPFRWCPAT